MTEARDLPNDQRLLAAFMQPTRRLIVASRRYPKLVLSFLVLAITVAWVFGPAWRGDYFMHSPGPVALAHARLDCGECHVRPWQSLTRLTGGDQRHAHEVMDQACIVCHPGLVHHEQAILEAVPHCVTCHREHRGPHDLAKAGDATCTACHAELRTPLGPSVRFASNVTSMRTHPEFAVLRRGKPDRDALRFNHAAHLPPTGLRGLDGQAVVLTCGTCHQATPDGRYLQPIRFQLHCAECHANALFYDVERSRDRPVPHGETPEALRGILRERYAEFIQGHPQELGRVIPAQRTRPGKSDTNSVTKDKWTWVQERIDRAEQILFQGAGGCRYCHAIQQSEQGWRIVPIDIPERWLPHGRFSHFHHRLHPKPVEGSENCTACHEGARSSTRARDVLIPSIQNCRECHAPQAGPRAGSTDCIGCHVYHNQIGGRSRGTDCKSVPRKRMSSLDGAFTSR
jgi:hypothetical protein